MIHRTIVRPLIGSIAIAFVALALAPVATFAEVAASPACISSVEVSAQILEGERSKSFSQSKMSELAQQRNAREKACSSDAYMSADAALFDYTMAIVDHRKGDASWGLQIDDAGRYFGMCAQSLRGTSTAARCLTELQHSVRDERAWGGTPTIAASDVLNTRDSTPACSSALSTARDLARLIQSPTVDPKAYNAAARRSVSIEKACRSYQMAAVLQAYGVLTNAAFDHRAGDAKWNETLATAHKRFELCSKLFDPSTERGAACNEALEMTVADEQQWHGH